MIGPDELRRVRLSAADVNKIESRWIRLFENAMERMTKEILANAAETGRLNFSCVDFEDLVMRHSLETMGKALDHSVDYMPVIPASVIKLAAGKPPSARVPRNFKDLRKMWDLFRKKKYIPPRQRALAQRIREQYLKRVQDYWVRYGEAFRKGDTGERKVAVSRIMQGADVAYRRAKMIVETETTYYYNKTRIEVYDASSDVTHYLFMAIRDHRTTEWCKTRHGLVYAKTDPLFHDEKPPCHWNCRSEVLPLTPHNPRHRALIDDHSKARRYNTCEPLPEEWGGR
jgi:SPP1 gp7 family putative phage head morphogenesis protein